MPRITLTAYITMYERGRALSNLDFVQGIQVGAGFAKQGEKITKEWSELAELKDALTLSKSLKKDSTDGKGWLGGFDYLEAPIENG